MSLFQKSVLKKYLQGIDQEKLTTAWQKFQAHFHNPEIQENIRNAKEEEYQEGFVRDLFVSIFVYTLKPQPNYNFVLEKKTETDATKSDGAMLRGENIIGVLELKDTDTTELGKVEKQAFGYKNKHKHCAYVIISNFEKLRFYIDDATEFIEFNLFTLTRGQFEILYLCLEHQSIQNDIPLKVKQESTAEEESITKKLYADYSDFKKTLFNNIVELNPSFNKLDLFKKTQKLLDRFLFILFAEDRLLLPPNSVREILQQWEQLKELDNYIPLYDRFKKYFGYLNTGYEGKQYEIFAYNGGLFAPDEILDSITVDDEILDDGCKKLSHYDFESEIDVNILGHIFEHSLGEIEEVQAELEGTALDKTKTRRKKDGVFYTPRYITKYIVENTLGQHCNKKKEELKINDEIFAFRKRKDKKREALVEVLDKYRKWLLQLTICDPACGSGAFLNQALEYLISEHRYVDELKATFLGDALVLTDLENEILQNNLFGVDINEEAVEIARLSLWLRTARKGRKLSNLSNNIKCGNSLIENPVLAGEKAFSWKDEFKSVFANNGFDIIIGNPPYVPAEMINESDKRYFEATYQSAVGRLNLYPLFYELSIKLGHQESLIGLITPYTILKNQYYSSCRKYILDHSYIEQIIDFKGVPVFSDAAVDSIIIIMSVLNTSNNNIEIIDSIKDFGNKEFNQRQLSQKSFLEKTDYSFEIVEQKLDISKIMKDCVTVENVIDFNQGIITGDNKRFITAIVNENTKKVITGSDFNRYSLNWNGQYIIYDEEHLHRPRKRAVFEASEKILLRQTASYPICAYDNSMYYTLDTVHCGLSKAVGFDLKYLLCLLNSRLLRYLYESSINEQGKVFAQVKIIYIDPLPIKVISESDQLPFIEIANLMLAKNSELYQQKRHLLKLLRNKYEALVITNKLAEWPDLSFNELLKELTKQKIKLSLPEQAEWMEYFDTEKEKAIQLQQFITKTDKEIDKMVYKLYELTIEEQSVIEGAL